MATGPDVAASRAFQRVAFDLADGRLAALRFPAETPKRRMLFCHANGFCASAYLKVFDALPRDIEVLALDLRGHGRTQLPANPRTHRSWEVYGRDINAVLDRIGPDDGDWILAGHSMGAVSVLLAAAGRRGSRVADLRLIEPPVLPSAFRALARTPFARPVLARTTMVKGALGRRAHWPDRDAALASYAGKTFFSSWAPGVLADYLVDGLADATDGDGVRLACAPEWEAANFMSHAHPVFGAVRTFHLATDVRISLLAAGPRSTVSRGDRLRFRSAGAHVRETRAAGHLLPMERPKLAAAFLVGRDIAAFEAENA